MAQPQQVEFLVEAREHLTDVCDQLLRLERAAADEARGRIEHMLRAVHSIKGGAGFLGLKTIERLAHRMETVLEAAAAPIPRPAPRMIDVLLSATDRLTALLDDVDHSNAAGIDDVLGRLDRLLEPDAAAPEPRAASAADDAAAQLVAESAALPTSPPRLEFELEIDLSAAAAAGISPAAVVERVRQRGEILAGRIEVAEMDLAEGPPRHPVIWKGTIQSDLEKSAFVAQLGLALPPAERAAADAQLAAATPAVSGAGGAPATAGTIRIPVDLVDQLMTLAGELVLVRNQSRRFTDADQPLPGQVLQRLDSVTTAFQETVLQTRMQPVGNLFNKFPRLVRDLSRQLDKQLELKISGAEVELDKTILDALSDPLTHLVRNACDHGIESAAERQQAGKPAAGTLQLAARHFGDQIWITIEDDGRGINREAVRRKALEQKLRTAEELARLDDRDLLALILLPGFSTAAQVTDVSGRGVGMDVVKTNLARLGGGIDIDSEPGRGTTFTLRLPLTLAIIPTLLVAADGQRYAIPQKDLDELVFVDPAQPRARIEATPDGEVVRLRDRLLPLLRLTNVLREKRGVEKRQADAAASAEPVIFAVVRAGSRRFGLIVDAVLTSEEIVVKPLHTRLRRLTRYSGATVLGDGRTALILNTEGIALEAQVRFHADREQQATETEAAERQNVLVVRRLNGEPWALPMTLIRRVVMVEREQLERVAHGCFVTLDGAPLRLVGPAEDLQRLGESKNVFIVLPRHATEAVGVPVGEVVGSEQVDASALHALAGNADGLGAAVIEGRITPLADLSAWLPSPANLPAAPVVPASGSGAKVLVVDDTQFFRDVVGRYLVENGYRVVAVEDGAQALARLAAEKFDIVVSDLEMPVMDGWTLAAQVRQDPALRHLPLLSLSTLSGEEAQAKSLAHGFDAHEVKLDRGSLLARIEQLLAGRGSRRSAAEAYHG